MQAVDNVAAVLASRDRELEDWGNFEYPHHWADLLPALLDPTRRAETVALLDVNDRAAETAASTAVGRSYEYPARWADIAPVLFSEKWEQAVALLEWRDRSLESFTEGVDG